MLQQSKTINPTPASSQELEAFFTSLNSSTGSCPAWCVSCSGLGLRLQLHEGWGGLGRTSEVTADRRSPWRSPPGGCQGRARPPGLRRGVCESILAPSGDALCS